jgi:hypothetical protein
VFSFSGHSLGIQSCHFEFPRCLVIVTDFWSQLHSQYCETRVITVVPYSGVMFRDHGAATEPRATCVSGPHKFLLGARRYQGLWTWSIVVPQLVCSHSLEPILGIHTIILLNYLNPLMLQSSFDLGCNFMVSPYYLKNFLQINVFDTFPFPLLNPTG